MNSSSMKSPRAEPSDVLGVLCCHCLYHVCRVGRGGGRELCVVCLLLHEDVYGWRSLWLGWSCIDRVLVPGGVLSVGEHVTHNCLGNIALLRIDKWLSRIELMGFHKVCLVNCVWVYFCAGVFSGVVGRCVNKCVLSCCLFFGLLTCYCFMRCWMWCSV